MKRNTREEIEEIAARLKGSNGERTAAIAELCTAFEPLVQSMAARYCQPVIEAEQDELEQEARVGLLEAINTFDRSKGAFAAHAQWRIRSALSSYVQRLENPTRLPTRLVHALPKLRALMLKIAHTTGGEPAIADLAEGMSLSEQTIAAMLAYDNGAMPLNIECRNGETYSISWEAPLISTFPSAELTPEELLMIKEEKERS